MKDLFELPERQYFRAVIDTLNSHVKVTILVSQSCFLITPVFVSRDKFFGHSINNFVNEDDYLNHIHEGDRERVRKVKNFATQNRENVTIEYRIFDGDLNILWIEETCRLIVNESGHPDFWICTFTDITEQKNLINELESARKTLQDVLGQVELLSGLIPICSYCNKSRNDKEYWQRLEKYQHHHLTDKLDKNICPECLKNVRTRLAGIIHRTNAASEPRF
ncbi:MAG: PAS domain-containing protein [Acidobacteriota bacterium]